MTPQQPPLHHQGIRKLKRKSVASFVLFFAGLFLIGCNGEVELSREVPVTVEVIREVPATVEVTREVPVIVEVTREVTATVEVTREVPVTVEVTREVTATVEVTREVPVTVEVKREAAPVTSFQQDQKGTGGRLNLVRERGKLICAGRTNVPGWGYLDLAGNNVGFDIDLCRAVATAVLGDPHAVEVRPITAAERGPTIQAGEVDLMVRDITWTVSRDAKWGNYPHTMFYDGQGFLTRRSLGLKSALELTGARVCVVANTTTELNLLDFSKEHQLEIEVAAFESTEEALLSYQKGHCESLTNDHSQLVILASVLQDPTAHTVLPETISEEPMGPVVPHGDDQWFDIVKTVMSILIYGEAYGITSDSVPAKPTGILAVDKFLGYQGSFGQDSLGLSLTVAQDVLRAVGNYGQIYSRNLDAGGIHLAREGSRNALWADAPCEDCPKGGQIYAAPLR